jgi:peptide-methionine (S)-S-oxide reductase
MIFGRKPTAVPSRDGAPKGRDFAIPTAQTHFLNGRDLKQDVPDGMDQAMFGMGCFWGVERLFWQTNGVWLTAVGYAAGYTPNATYQEVCSGKTGHNEVVRVIFDPAVISYSELLRVFWQGHDPTQGLRQGNDRGSQYRSGVYTYSAQQTEQAQSSKAAYQAQLSAAGHAAITTEVIAAPEFYYAEDYHQQYLAKNPAGYCGLGGTGVTCPIGLNA